MKESDFMKTNPMKGGNSQPRYVNYEDGARIYGMCKNSFARLAKEANAVSKIGKICIVNVQEFETFLETFKPR